MRQLLEEGVRRGRTLGAEHVEVRAVAEERRRIKVADGQVERLASDETAGVGVRVLWDGAWGFAARPRVTAEAVEEAVADAAAVARAARTLSRRRVELAEEEPQRGTYRTPVVIDPFADGAAGRALGLLLATHEAIARAAAATSGMTLRRAEVDHLAARQRKQLATSDGTFVEQELVWCGAGLRVIVSSDGGSEVQHRSYPMDLDGGVAAGGEEVVAALDLVGAAPQVVDEARQLLSAAACPSGRRTLLLDTPQLALQIHESCGHATECDRAFGEEVSLAGGSFLRPERLGRYRYGSTLVNLSADACTAGGLGTFGWDDEGVPARRTPLVARGQHVGYLTSRETAARLGLPRSGGTVRAAGWNRVPIIRMVNVNLEPDERGPTLDEMIADTDDGVLMTTNRSWSIDDLRLNFQFGCEAGWEIKHGRRTRLLKNPLYTGITPRFWAGCDAVGRPSEFRVWGFISCGKGDPIQLMGVGHGCPPARFRDVEIGAR